MIANDSFLVAEKAEVEVPTVATLVEIAMLKVYGRSQWGCGNKPSGGRDSRW